MSSSLGSSRRSTSSSSSLSSWSLLARAVVVGVLSLRCLTGTMASSTSRAITIMNDSGSRIEIYWIHPTTREESLISKPDIMNGATFPLNSYVGHEFEIRELPGSKSGVCAGEDQTCRSNFFTVSENSDQTITINAGIEVEFLDDQIRAQMEAGELVELCRAKAKARLEAAGTNIDEVQASMDDLVRCVEAGVAETISKANEEIAFQATVRKGMAAFMENYTCADTDLETGDPLREEKWTGAKDRKKRNVKIMLDRPASKIHVVSDFISPAECKAMEDAAKPKLHRATVADGKGGSEYSPSRKAMQAGIAVAWEKEAKGDHIAILSRRVYDYTNHVLELDIEEHGQEDLMSIQYFGRGANDTTPDRYTPHCDGDCNGLPFKTGNRMATMVMYCTVPKTGGHTNFRNAGVHVKPESGSAIFFSYINPETLIMDNGFTEHSGCPVYEGEKKIVTQWIRLGVDDDNPWDSFNTLGVKMSNDEL